jgi:anti-anti-sigma regulatory factor
MLAELSTPLLTISATTVVMPLVGAVDSRRVAQIMDTLLNGVSASRASIVILDITGVSVVDTQVADAFIRASQAVSLLGAQVVLTGIRPEVAQTLVQLGVDLRSIITRGTLQDGITYALRT